MFRTKIALRNPRIIKGDTDTDTDVIFEEISMYAARKTVSLFQWQASYLLRKSLTRGSISMSNFKSPHPLLWHKLKRKKNRAFPCTSLSSLSLFCAFPPNGSLKKTISSNTDELISLFYLCKVFDWQARCLRHSRLVVVIPFFLVPFINYLSFLQKLKGGLPLCSSLKYTAAMFSPWFLILMTWLSCSSLSFKARFAHHFWASAARSSDQTCGWEPCSPLSLLWAMTQNFPNSSYALVSWQTRNHI